MDLNTTTIGAAFAWAIIWVLLPDRILNQRPALKRIFFALGILLGAAALFILLTQHG
jgi:hypothetical protein